MRISLKPLGVFFAAAGWMLCVCAAGGAGEDVPDRWQLNHGGEGGGTSGAYVATDIGETHSGARALVLSAGPLPRTTSHAWASASQKTACSAGEHLTVQAWLRRGSIAAGTNATLQCIIEYFEDDECRQPVSQHMRMTGNLPTSGFSPERWTRVDLSDTVPGRATTLRVSIVLALSGPDAGRHEIAVDDVKIVVTRPATARRPK